MALEALATLDPAIKARVLAKINWLAENLEGVTPEPLHRGLRGLYRLRIGDYRATYSVSRRTTVTIVMVGHRRDIYR